LLLSAEPAAWRPQKLVNLMPPDVPPDTWTERENRRAGNGKDFLVKLSMSSITGVKKVEFSHTRYRALGPELIPLYRQSARRRREVNHGIDWQ